ncbi:ATP-binding cassette domain-containing protein [uncultured Cohaesibacter sp.]|uniref:ATP-binding cassette domain-containing protein n=1 Tax=uncultured Cohaesibacter sp. TaxID=1002546 RepID=UPI0029C615F8|nr:ATP-binding cassette domain-containing protein [uncultured Cohaesibacter sp.]
MNTVDLDVVAGRIHAVLGENGAGKSTLLKCLAGTLPASEGTIEVNGDVVALSDPGAARACGISCVFQEMSLIQDLSVAENIQLASPPRKMGLIDRQAERRRAEELLKLVGAEDVSPNKLVRDLPLSRRQLVEIAKGLASNPRLLILDESTSALTEQDSQHILSLARQLADDGLAILYVSHRMAEIEQLADDCSIFRDGSKVDSFVFETKTADDMVRMMMGRAIDASLPRPAPLAKDLPSILQLKGLTWAPALNSIDLELRRGEVLGIGGLDGQGQHEILLAVFGALKGMAGKDGTGRQTDHQCSAFKADGNDPTHGLCTGRPWLPWSGPVNAC